ncbi:MAG TPA: response regulator [Blastococcus sp.]|jgi:two-component system CitB family response regulator|nr:response regulator [Blastococcus sp.]
MTLRVVVVDDDFRVAQLHAQFVAAVPGFEVAAVVHDGAATRRVVAALRPDLVLLDMYLPDELGTDLAPHLSCDVLMVTAASDAGSVRRALGAGVINYLVKPFTLPELADRLRAYARYRLQLERTGSLQQADIDRAVRTLREGDLVDGTVPKGRSPQTARLVADCLRGVPDPQTATDVASQLGLSRPTAQRYLADLAAAGRVEVTLRYGTAGRPEHRYAWRGDR